MVVVCDRENFRIKTFEQDGSFLALAGPRR